MTARASSPEPRRGRGDRVLRNQKKAASRDRHLNTSSRRFESVGWDEVHRHRALLIFRRFLASRAWPSIDVLHGVTVVCSSLRCCFCARRWWRTACVFVVVTACVRGLVVHHVVHPLTLSTRGIAIAHGHADLAPSSRRRHVVARNLGRLARRRGRRRRAARGCGRGWRGG